MHRFVLRTFLLTFVVIYLAQCLPFSKVNAFEPDDGRPNIVFLLADDLGWTGLRCFGSDFYETPYLDAFAKQGMKFTNAYSACTVCSPTRASVMTGMYPARLRLTDFIAGQNRPFAKLRIPEWTKRLESHHVTIAEALQSSGYRTAHVGKWHLETRSPDKTPGTQPTEQGFDVSYPKPAGGKGYFLKAGTTARSGSNYSTDWLTDRACDFIESSDGEPFFLYFAYNVPHTPIQGRQDLVEYFEKKVDKDNVHINPVFAAMVASLDQSVGRILAQLKKNGLDDNTVVIFTSDNGGLTQRYGKPDGFTENIPLRRGKGSAYEGGVRVPTIVHVPGLTAPGSICETPIMTIDYYPTIIELANSAGDPTHNADVDGVSIIPLLKAPNSKLDRELYWHYPHYHAGGDGPYSAVRDGDWRLIEFHEDKRLELYDLAHDLGESTNLAIARPNIANNLHQKLLEWRRSIDAQMPSPNPNHDASKETVVARKR